MNKQATNELYNTVSKRGKLTCLDKKYFDYKNTLAYNIVQLHLDENKGLVIFSMKMSAEDVMMRILSIMTDIPLNRLQTFDLSDEEEKRLIACEKGLSDKTLYIDDGEANIHQLKSKIRELKHEDVSLCIIDDLQQIEGISEMKKTISELEILAKELDISILLLHGLSSEKSDKTQSNKLGYFFDEICVDHETGMHLEVAERCLKIDEMVQRKHDVKRLERSVGSKADLVKVHDESYVEWLERAYDEGIRMLISSDTIISEKSYEVALRIATSTKSTIDFFKEGGRRAFLNIRPPGHHAEIITGQGFCLFNNIALMARYAQDAGYEKVLIIDFDVHHGNGTQDIFYEDDLVYYFSTHEANNYPYIGTKEEIGKGKGEGYTRNMPYHDRIKDEDFLALFDALPKTFDPDIVLVSAGYDMMAEEKISSSLVSFDGLKRVVEKIVDDYHDKPIAFVLEGGYEIESLVKSVDITLEVLRRGC